MAFLKTANRAESTLDGGIGDADLSLDVAVGEGALFPAAGDFHITIEDEILVCTARAGDTLTVTRAAEGTIAAAHIDGKAVELRITKGVIDAIEAEIDAKVADADFTAAEEVMVGTGAGTHNQITLAASQVLGRLAAGNTTNVTMAQLWAILSGAATASVDMNDQILQKVKGYLLTTATELTLDAAGAITVTQMVHTVDTLGDAASDLLVTINGGTTVGLLILRPAHTDRSIVVDTGADNIVLQGGSDITLDDITDHIMLFWDTTNSKWVDFGGGGGGGGLSNIVEDVTPQLGEALDGQGFDLNNLGVAFLTEQAAAEADVAGKGQLWVKTAIPNEQWFTDDLGTDMRISGGWEVVQKTVLTSAAASITMSGLDVNTDVSYILFYRVLNNVAAVRVLYLFFNGDTTASNYHSQKLAVGHTSVAGYRYNDPRIGGVNANDNCCGWVFVSRDPTGYARWHVLTSKNTPASVAIQNFCGAKSATVANITSLQLAVNSAGNDLAIGTSILLCRPRHG